MTERQKFIEMLKNTEARYVDSKSDNGVEVFNDVGEYLFYSFDKDGKFIEIF